MFMVCLWTACLCLLPGLFSTAAAQGQPEEAASPEDRRYQVPVASGGGSEGDAARGSAAEEGSREYVLRPRAFSPNNMKFSAAQRAMLMLLGARLDAFDLRVAERLGGRGFGSEAFVSSYRKYSEMRSRGTDYRHFDRWVVETIAVGTALNLSEKELGDLVSHRHDAHLSITEAYNRHVAPKKAHRNLGIIFTTIGAAAILGGGLFLGLREDRYGQDKKSHVIMGITGLSLGGLCELVGIPLLVYGVMNPRETYPEGALDSEPVERLRSRAADRR